LHNLFGAIMPIRFTETTEPATPPTDKVWLYADSADKKIKTKDDAGTVRTIEQGPQGDPGEGVPTGGTTGQILAKASAADYDTQWTTDDLQSTYSGGNAVAIDTVPIQITNNDTVNNPSSMTVQHSAVGIEAVLVDVSGVTGTAYALGIIGGTSNDSGSQLFYISNGGSGEALNLSQTGTAGKPVQLTINNAVNPDEVLNVRHQGLGKAIKVDVTLSGNTAPGIEVNHAGNGSAVVFENISSTIATAKIRNTDSSGPLIDLAGSTSGSVKIQVPNTVTTYPIVLPDTQGGGALMNDGIGNLYWNILDASDVGLENVDNTSDANKPVSTATQTALDLKVNGPLESLNEFLFGGGTDGNVTISSGTTTLTQDMAYNNLTINGTGKLNPNGFRIFVRGILDLTAAPAGAIEYVTTNGGNSGGTTAGTQAGVLNTGTIGSAQRGNAAQAGGTAAGTAGGSAATSNTLAVNVGGRGGAGGLGASGAGGAQGGIPTIQNTYIPKRYDQIFKRGTVLVGGGSQGSSGGSGGGDGTAGGGSGASGSSGGIVWLAAKTINRDSAGTAAGAIRALGGNGGNGGTPAGGNRGGGGGGAGGTGGFVNLTFNALTGTLKTGLIHASGGSGGNGGNGTGTGIGGAGGGNGGGGSIFVLNVGASNYTTSTGPVSVNGGAASGTTGGTGTAIVTHAVDL
jgi:hypothetical protein